MTPSPDGTSSVYVAEHRLDGTSDYTLTVMVGATSGIPRATYSLTPRYGPAVQSPSGAAIAYRAYDYTRKGPVYIYGTGVLWPHPYPPSACQQAQSVTTYGGPPTVRISG